MKTIQIDLDGVLNTYCGNYDEKIIPQPRKGTFDFLKILSNHYDIEIFTVRNHLITAEWLIDNNLRQFISDITSVKNPKSSIFIDDRAIRFNGDYDEILEEIINFQPYWKK